jgi:hypothetical protein
VSLTPLRPVAGGEGGARRVCAGRVRWVVPLLGMRGFPHLTITLSAPKGGEWMSGDAQSISRRPSHPEIIMQLVGAVRDILVADHVDDLPVLDDIMAVGEGRGEVEILLDEEDRETLLLQPAD